MRIALVYDLIYPFSIGGAEYRNFSLAEQLVLMGHEVHLFGVKMWPGSKTKKITERFYIHGVSSYKGKYQFTGKRKPFEPLKYSLALFFELMKHDFDIIDVTAFPYFPAFSCKLCSLLKREPLVVTWHEIWGKYWSGFGMTGFFGKIVERAAAKLSKNNICVSKPVADDLKKIGGRNIATIENWIDTKEIDKAKKTEVEYDLISIGRHMKHKNFDLLLKIVSLLKANNPVIKVLIIGNGPETIKLLKIRRTLDLEKNVDILSFSKDHKQVYSYMKSSKLFVLLSELEGFSIVAFEAMRCGLPVITLNHQRNALASFIDGKNGCVLEKKEIEVAHKIGELLNDKKQLNKMSSYAKKFAGEYGVKKQAKKIEEYYRRIK